MAKTTYSVLQRAVKEYGNDEQMRMAQEECSELTVALSKYHRSEISGDKRKFNRAAESVIEEVVDVEIMCRQMHIILGNEDAFSTVRDFKLNRLEERLNKLESKRK
ncbi:MAG: hypothetical protein LKF53_02775 [Solobacterium sp.]|jgi:hypothetical protein|nr:hypothetical protein [Solobacterium sp.]MCH4205303.1 hypothetical protein [Solobacterium sp.]MCH4226896.1 hypothetical protein [Solobacterium sp.]MCH4281656.1 hypothetical protein [Solobacterium sp.]